MKFALLLSLPITLTLAFSGSAAPPASPLATPPENAQVIAVTAKKYRFDPSPIRVKVGRRVQLKITATDHAHGFSIEPSPEGAENRGKTGLVFSAPQGCQRIPEGQTATVEFVAQMPGTYPFHCCVHCGWHHRGMKGELIVEP
jgi:cytochrome c oxidase subunit II